MTRQGERRRAEALALARQQAARQAEAARAEARRRPNSRPGCPPCAPKASGWKRRRGKPGTAALAAREAADAARSALAEAERALADAQAARDAARKAVVQAQQRVNEAQSPARSACGRACGRLQELEAAQEGYFAGVKAVFEARKHGALAGEFTVVADAFQSPRGVRSRV